jgi:hypothetical protein
MPVSEMNSNISRKQVCLISLQHYMYFCDLIFLTKIVPTQDLTVKVKEHEEEITQLRKHLDNYLVKVTTLYKEKTLHSFCLFPFYLVPDRKLLLIGSKNTQ